MTAEDNANRQHEADLAQLMAAVDKLPAVAQEFFRTYRRHIELCGRAGPTGNQLQMLALFVDDLAHLTAALAPAPNPCEYCNGFGWTRGRQCDPGDKMTCEKCKGSGVATPKIAGAHQAGSGV